MKNPKNKYFNSKFSYYILSFFIILVITFTFFYPSLQNGLINFDDKEYIYENKLIQDFSVQSIGKLFTTPYSANYHPLTALTNAIEYKFVKDAPILYHLNNIVLHSIVCFTILIFLNLLIPNRIVVLIVVLFFAIHPLRVESVVWVSERKDLLYSLFYVLGMIWYVKYCEIFSFKKYSVLVLLFVLSLLSKSAAVVFPCSLLILDYYLKRPIFSKQSILSKAPLFLLSLLFGIIALKTQNVTTSITNIGALYTSFEKAILSLHALGFYFWKSILPFNLSALYFYPEKIQNTLPSMYVVSALLVLLSSVLLVWLLRRKRWFIFSLLFFITNLMLVLQIISVGQAMMADRYSYMPSIALCFLLALGLDCLTKREIKFPKFVLGTTGLLVLIVLGVLTWNRTHVWKDSISFASDLIEKYPKKSFGYYLRGDAFLHERQDYERAIQDFTKAIEYEPNMMWAFMKRSVAFVRSKKFENALQDCLSAYNLNPMQGDNLNNLSLIFLELGKQKEDTQNFAAAESLYSSALHFKPKMIDALNSRGRVRGMSGNFKHAIDDFTEIIKMDSNNINAYINRGNSYAMAGLMQESIKDYDKAISIDSNASQCFFNRCLAKLKLQDTLGCCNDWERAAQLGNQEAQNQFNRFCK